ncbi:RDD family protein [Candidatus Mycobacterium wuenschmannii]|uniref:RDD family protein n=1 Tax=Candidatus Mycobacterium wuenschmannii TaxID=3027808 RepID=A0ABY8W016_9MYCO|nr:RDD family protein [Candidatus Mycobacterium wuenschmannii]WIM89235.1 RDD family protein [Candidatus Mycobacterium wuenschmannii]
MTASNRPPGIGDSESPQGYSGESLGLPQNGPGSIVGMGRRLLALFVDWLIAVGLAGLAVPFGLAHNPAYSISGAWVNIATVIWLALGIIGVRLFQFTPGQFALGVRVASVDKRQLVGLGRATVRGLLIAFVIPALFVDTDGRGIQDRVTATAVVRR